MAGVKISALPASPGLDGTEIVPIVDGGITRRTTINAINALGTVDLSAYEGDGINLTATIDNLNLVATLGSITLDAQGAGGTIGIMAQDANGIVDISANGTGGSAYLSADTIVSISSDAGIEITADETDGSIAIVSPTVILGATSGMTAKFIGLVDSTNQVSMRNSTDEGSVVIRNSGVNGIIDIGSTDSGGVIDINANGTGGTINIQAGGASNSINISAVGDGGQVSVIGDAAAIIGAGSSGIQVDTLSESILFFVSGTPVLTLTVPIPEIPAVPLAQDIADVLVALGLATQAV